MTIKPSKLTPLQPERRFSWFLYAMTCTVVLVFLLSYNADAQYFRTKAVDPDEIPGLQTSLKKSRADKNRVNLYLKLSSIYIYRPEEQKVHLDSAFLLAGQALALSKKLHYRPGYNEGLLLTAATYIERNQWKQAKDMLLVTTDTTKIKLLAALCDFYWYGVLSKRDTGNKHMLDTAVLFGKQALEMSIASGRADQIRISVESLQQVVNVQMATGQTSAAERLLNYVKANRKKLPADFYYIFYRSDKSFLIAENTAKNHTGRLKQALKFASLLLYADGNKKEDLDRAFTFVQEAITLSLEQHDTLAYNDAQVLLSGIYMERNDIASSLRLLQTLKGITRLRVLSNYSSDYYYKANPFGAKPQKDQLDTAVMFNKEALVLSISLKVKAMTARLTEQLKATGSIYTKQHYEGAQEIQEFLLKTGPAGKYPGKAGIYLAIADEYFFKGDYDTSIYYTLKAEANVVTGTPDLTIAFIYMRFAQVYTVTKKTGKANDYILKVLNGEKRFAPGTIFYSIIYSYCNNLIFMQQPAKALEVLNGWYKKRRPEIIDDLYYYYNALGCIYTAMGNYKESEKNLLLALEYSGRISVKKDIYAALGVLYFDTKDYIKAEYYFSEALKATNLSHAAFNSSIYYIRAQIDTALGNYKSAVKYLFLQKEINDSIFSISKERHTQELMLQYQTQKKEADLKLKEENIRFLNQKTLLLNQKAVVLDQKAKIQQIRLDRARLLAEKKETDFQLQEKNIRFLNQNARLQRDQLKNAQITRNITIVFIILILIILLLLYRQYALKQKSTRTILNKNGMLEELLTEKDWLLKEVHHRVKNNLQTVISLLESQAAYLRDDALKAMENCQHRIFVMSLIHQKLYQSSDVKTVDMPSYIAEFLSNLADSFDLRQQIRFEQVIDPIELNVTEAMPLALVLNEAVTNSIKYAFPDQGKGTISITMHKSGNEIEMVIADNGIGIQQINTQGKAQTLGLKLIRGLCQDMDADIRFENHNGTRITIRFTANRLADQRQNH